MSLFGRGVCIINLPPKKCDLLSSAAYICFFLLHNAFLELWDLYSSATSTLNTLNKFKKLQVNESTWVQKAVHMTPIICHVIRLFLWLFPGNRGESAWLLNPLPWCSASCRAGSGQPAVTVSILSDSSLWHVEFLASVNIYDSDPVTGAAALLSSEESTRGSSSSCGHFWESLLEIDSWQPPPLTDPARGGPRLVSLFVYMRKGQPETHHSSEREEGQTQLQPPDSCGGWFCQISQTWHEPPQIWYF